MAMRLFKRKQVWPVIFCSNLLTFSLRRRWYQWQYWCFLALALCHLSWTPVRSGHPLALLDGDERCPRQQSNVLRLVHTGTSSFLSPNNKSKNTLKSSEVLELITVLKKIPLSKCVLHTIWISFNISFNCVFFFMRFNF